MASSSSGFLTLEGDLKEYSLEKDVKTNVKTEEELKLLSINESLNEIQRAYHILTCGQEVQHISILQNLPFIYNTWEKESIQKVVPKLARAIKNAGVDLQIAAAEVFKAIAKENSIPSSVFELHFIPLITSRLDSKDPALADAWLGCLLTTIGYLPKESIQDDLLSLILLRGKLSKPTTSRMSCCALLGAVVAKLSTEKIIKEIVPAMKQLCQDIDFTVRACMCAHLCPIAEALGAENTKTVILPEVLELAGDEEIQVRGAALLCSIEIAKLLPAEILKDMVVPLVCQYCESGVHKQDSSLPIISNNYGRFCYTFSDHYSKEKKFALLRSFRMLCKIGRTKTSDKIPSADNTLRMSVKNLLTFGTVNTLSPENREKLALCRRHCAYNFPAITLFCGRELFQKELMGALSVVSCDPDILVRKHIAASLHQIALQLGEEAPMVMPHFSQLLEEKDSPLVIEALFKSLPVLLDSIILKGHLGDNKSGASTVNELCNRIIATEVKLESKWPCSWRSVEIFAEHIATFPDFFSTEQVFQKVIPHVFKFLTFNQYLPVRTAAASSVCILLQRSRRLDHRIDICVRLVQELCHSRCYRDRILFLTVCSNMIKHFSRAFFKEHFFSHVLDLINDPVANVRIQLWRILPSLKKILLLPRDRTLHGLLEASIRKMLASEADKDVSAVLKSSILEMDRIKVTMETLTGQPLPIDKDDQNKEKDEKLVVEDEEKQDELTLKVFTSSRQASDTKPGVSRRSNSAFNQSSMKDKRTSQRHVSDHGLRHSPSQSKSLDVKSKLFPSKTVTPSRSITSNDMSYLPPNTNATSSKDGQTPTTAKKPTTMSTDHTKGTPVVQKPSRRSSPNEEKKPIIPSPGGNSPKSQVKKKP